jgi:hypothetical protein
MTHVTIERAKLEQVLDALWVLNKHNALHHGVNHNTVATSREALAICEQALAALTVQEPVGKVIASVPHLRSISVELLPEVPVPPAGSLIYTAPPAAPVPLEDQRKLPENAARLIIEAWIKENYGYGYSYHLSDQDEGTSWAWWINSHPFEDPNAAMGFDGGTSWIDFEGKISDYSSIPDEFNTRMQAPPPAAQRQWVGLMQGVRVEREYVVVSVHGGNGAARKLCEALIQEMNT